MIFENAIKQSTLVTIFVAACGIISLAAEVDSPADTYARQNDVVYGYKDGLAMVMDVLTPKTNRNGAGVLIIMSGGLASDPSVFRGDTSQGVDDRCSALLRNGYVVFLGFHGSRPKYTLPEVQQDMPRAVRFIRNRANQFGIGRNRIGVMGSSSGGLLALHVSTAAPGPNSEATDLVDRESSRVQAAVAYFPPTDLVNFGEPNVTIQDHLQRNSSFDFRKWDAAKDLFVKVSAPSERKEIFLECSPVTHVSRDDPPVLLFHGNRDKAVPIQQSKVFHKQMQQAGAVCKLVEVSGKGHGWNPPVNDELSAVLEWFDKWLVSAEKR